MSLAQKTFVLVAGGTGGHLFPAEALAAELLQRGHKPVIFTDKRGRAFKSLGEKVPIHCIQANYFKPGLFEKIKAVFFILAGMVQSLFLLIKYRPTIVIGFGGYPSFPGVLTGQLLGIPTVIHEQNAVLGKANRWLAKRAGIIAVSFPGTTGIPPATKEKTVVTGNPVRADILAVRDIPYQTPTDKIRIFITGGSQAARIFSDVVPKAVSLLPKDMQARLQIFHQCRQDSLTATAAQYKTAGIDADIRPFFDNMAEQLQCCHLFIGRSGASTVSEIAIVGRPAIFVPMQHADMQQKLNAETLTGFGGGWLIPQTELTAAAFAQKLENIVKEPDLLAKAAALGREHGQPGATKKLADIAEKLA